MLVKTLIFINTRNNVSWIVRYMETADENI